MLNIFNNLNKQIEEKLKEYVHARYMQYINAIPKEHIQKLVKENKCPICEQNTAGIIDIIPRKPIVSCPHCFTQITEQTANEVKDEYMEKLKDIEKPSKAQNRKSLAH